MTNQKPSRVVCHYCHNPRHIRRDYRKLQNINQRFQCALESLKGVSTPSTMLVGLGKPNTCLNSFASKWVIDSGATNHMTGNSSLFTMFQPHPSTSIVTLTDGSTSYVLGSETIHPTSLITLTFVLNLSQFSFNLIYVSKLTRTLKCSISFFPDYCLILDFSKKRVIGRVCESMSLYIL